jgi:hypothetical protein
VGIVSAPRFGAEPLILRVRRFPVIIAHGFSGTSKPALVRCASRAPGHSASPRSDVGKSVHIVAQPPVCGRLSIAVALSPSLYNGSPLQNYLERIGPRLVRITAGHFPIRQLGLLPRSNVPSF